MNVASVAPWAVLAGYCLLVWRFSPRSVSAKQFFGGQSAAGKAPGLWLLVFSAAITWVFAKSIANAADLANAFGPIGGVGYATYYLSFFVAAAAIYFIRVRGGHNSLPAFLVAKYGPLCARLFLIAISIRLFNEVWSNTKVGALYFGAEGEATYWLAVILITAFTIAYSWRGGLRSSMLTDAGQMLLAAILLTAILIAVFPPLVRTGIPSVPPAVHLAGVTFLALAAVQVLTDRAFLTSPKTMVKGFIIAGLLSGGFILLFSSVGLYARAFGLEGSAVVAVPVALGLPLLLVFNAIMLASAGSTLDSTFASTAKLTARDWPDATTEATERQRRIGRRTVIVIAVIGNLPLLSVLVGDKAGPAIIAATTISGTMVMGLAPIFLLSFIRRAGPLSFHLAFWTGLALGVLMTVESATGIEVFPGWIEIGTGRYADDLGVNVYGLLACTAGYLLGAVALPVRRLVPQAS